MLSSFTVVIITQCIYTYIKRSYYTLYLYIIFTCQLHLNKTEGEKKKKPVSVFQQILRSRKRKGKTSKNNLPFCLWSLLPHRNLGPLVPLKICPDVINMHKSLHQFVPFQLYSELLQHDCHLHLAIGQDLHKRVWSVLAVVGYGLQKDIVQLW